MLPADNGTAYEHLPSVLHVPTATGSMLTLQHVLFRTIEPQTYPYTSELFVAVPFFFMWVLIRKLLFKTVLLKSARLMGAPDELTEYKWAVLAWNGLFHVWSTLWLLSWLPLHRWYWDTRYLWENILAEQPQKLELEFKCFYMLQLGYHMQSIVWHFFEEHRPDFVTMMVHHVVTVCIFHFPKRGWRWEYPPLWIGLR
ncbi:hypothetical protein DIPPA_28566 [Diplonema papillatum]|nr:hypothetical protein DIPPA_28566 [Diplonema papillatum]